MNISNRLAVNVMLQSIKSSCFTPLFIRAGFCYDRGNCFYVYCRMKKFFLWVAASLFLVTPVLAEKIDTYTVHLKVNQDGTFQVHEDILYDFEGMERHGIYRDIPFEYGGEWIPKKINIDNVSVTNEMKVPYNFDIFNENGSKRIKIGDANKLITGKKMYSIDYTVKNALLFQEAGDVVEWNAIGTDWSVPIDQAQVEIEVAGGIAPSLEQTQCFQGNFSSTETCTKVTPALFRAESLTPHEGMTVQLQFPAQTFPRPSSLEKLLTWLAVLWPFFIPILTFIILFTLWWKTGRDPKGRGTIIPEFDAPDNLTPAQVGSLVDEKVSHKDISAEIIFLAEQGYIRIVQQEKEGIFGKKKFVLEKLKSEETLKHAFDSLLMKSLFAGKEVNESGVLARVSLDDLKYTFSQKYVQVVDSVQKNLVDEKYFTKNPQTVRVKYTVICCVFAGFVYFLVSRFSGSTNILFLIISIAANVLLFVIFAPLMPARTEKGVLAREHILGLKQYLSVAEKDRINFHNAPEKNPQVFEKFLPYAMVLGVEEKWAKYFEDIYRDMSPSWYVSNSGAHFNALLLTQSLHNFSAVSGATLASPPPSKGGIGGGFSGGGFGGGGGGSW